MTLPLLSLLKPDGPSRASALIAIVALVFAVFLAVYGALVLMQRHGNEGDCRGGGDCRPALGSRR